MADIRFIADGTIDEAFSTDMSELAELIEDKRIKIKRSSVTLPGVKADIVVGLAAATLAVNAVATVFGILAYWQAQKNVKYVVRIETKSKTFELESAKTELAQMDDTGSTKINIIIHRA